MADSDGLTSCDSDGSQQKQLRERKKQKHEDESADGSQLPAVSFHSKYVPWTKEVNCLLLQIYRIDQVTHAHGHWTLDMLWARAQEDQELRGVVEQLGAKNWSKIAESMPARTSKSCRLRCDA